MRPTALIQPLPILPLHILDLRFRLRRGLHILSLDRESQVSPQSARLVRLLLRLRRDPFRRDVLAILLCVEKRRFFAGLQAESRTGSRLVIYQERAPENGLRERTLLLLNYMS